MFFYFSIEYNLSSISDYLRPFLKQEISFSFSERNLSTKYC